VTAEVSAAEAKACCASAYSSDAVALVLGASYHPGGLALTRRLAGAVGLRPGDHVLDVASGPGTTALLLAQEHDVMVVGVDLGEANVERARTAAADAGLADRVTFHVGDAERLPFEDATFDAVVCECAFCTFPDKPTAATELARVLRPGGRLGLTDVTVAPGGLPPQLAGLAGWVACLADARPAEEYAAILARAGLETSATERHDDALHEMVEQVRARVSALRMVARSGVAGIDFPRVLELTDEVRRAVDDGAAGYALLVATRTTG
jgi:ubiquinone/menaquinone biosynthesis C-methylase UbiE